VRVLVRLPNWLGDALLARPLLAGLRRALADVELYAVGPAAVLQLLGPGAGFARADAWTASPGERRSLVARVRAWSPEVAVVLPPSFSSAWFAFRSGARERVGFAHEGRSPLLTRALRRPPRGDMHLSHEYAALGEILGATWTDPGTLPVPRGDREAARSLLGARADAERPIAVLAPGALYGPAKRWPAARFVEIARRCIARGDVVAVCGSAADREVCDAVAREAGPPARSLAGRTDLATQTGLLAESGLAVCNDSGLAHLAAATGTPTVALFGSTSSAWTAPLGPRVRVVQRAPVCSPCFQRSCAIGYVCLERIEVDAVWRAALEIAA
jgi:heptosyltransferase-2